MRRYRAGYVCALAVALGAIACESSAPEANAPEARAGEQSAALLRSVTLRFPAGSIGDVPVVALSGALSIGDRAKLQQANGTPAGANQLGTDAVSVGVESQLGSLIAQGPTVLRNRALIDGNLTGGSSVTIPADASVTGTVSRNSTLTPYAQESLETSLSANANAPVTLETDVTRSLAPGAYGALVAKSRSRLKLRAGDYAFSSAQIEPQSIIEVDDAAGAVRLFLDTGLTFRGSVVSSTSASAAPTFLVVSFNGNITLDAAFRGSVIAAAGSIMLGPGGQPHEGSFFGRSIEVRPDTVVKYRPYFKLEAVPRFALPRPSSGPYGVPTFDQSGGFLAPTMSSVVAVSSSGGVSTLFAYPKGGAFALDRLATHFGTYTDRKFELRTRANNVVASVPLEPAGFGAIVPGTALAYVPELGPDPEKPKASFARFFDTTGQRARFATPGLRVSRVSASHLIYATKTELVKVSHAGQEAWRKPLKLMTFELSASGTRLLGVLDAPGRSEVVNVDLASGNVLGSTVLATSFWSLALSPSGRYAAAATKDRLYLFDGGVLSRELTLPVRWAVSLDVSDAGYAAVGGQSADHTGLLILVGPPGTAMSTQTRQTETQAYRPAAQFYPDGTRLLLNETFGLTAFDIQRVR